MLLLERYVVLVCESIDARADFSSVGATGVAGHCKEFVGAG